MTGSTGATQSMLHRLHNQAPHQQAPHEIKKFFVKRHTSKSVGWSVKATSSARAGSRRGSHSACRRHCLESLGKSLISLRMLCSTSRKSRSSYQYWPEGIFRFFFGLILDPPRYICFYSEKRQIHWYRPVFFPIAWPF